MYIRNGNRVVHKHHATRGEVLEIGADLNDDEAWWICRADTLHLT